MGEPLPSACLSSHSWAAARGTFSGHFRVLVRVPSASKVQGGKQSGGTQSWFALQWSLVPVVCQRPDLRRGRGAHSGEPQQEGKLAPTGSVPTPQVQGTKAEGKHSAGHSSSTHDYTHTSQAGGFCEGFGNYYNHLLCWVETDPVSLCFRALKAREASRSRFQLRGYTIVRTEEKKPQCWPELTSFFQIIAPVY